MFDADISYFTVPIVCFAFAWILDRIFGDPISLPHLVVGYGKLISFWEKRANRTSSEAHVKRIHGALMGFVLTYGVLLVTIAIIYSAYSTIPIFGVAISIILIFYCLAGTSLIREVKQVFKAVDLSVDAGRAQVARIVGRDTSQLSPQEIRIAALETLAENLNDGVIAPIFYFFGGVLLGLLLHLVYPLATEVLPLSLGVGLMTTFKMVNTLDSMVAYKNDRYIDYGRYSAIQDDIWGYIPARITAIMLLLSAKALGNWSFVKRFGRAHLSPNSGYPEAAMASLLNCRFGGPHNYFGKEVYKPYIGINERLVDTKDCKKSIHFAQRAEFLSILTFIVIAFIVWLSVMSL